MADEPVPPPPPEEPVNVVPTEHADTPTPPLARNPEETSVANDPTSVPEHVPEGPPPSTTATRTTAEADTAVTTVPPTSLPPPAPAEVPPAVAPLAQTTVSPPVPTEAPPVPPKPTIPPVSAAAGPTPVKSSLQRSPETPHATASNIPRGSADSEATGGLDESGEVDEEEGPTTERASIPSGEGEVLPGPVVEGSDAADPHGEAPAVAPTEHKKKEEELKPAATDLSENPDGLSAPFQIALASRFDKVPAVWGKSGLALTLDNVQARLRERLAHAEAQKNAVGASTVSEDADKKHRPEREHKFRPVRTMYRKKPAVSEEQLTELIWGNYETRIIDLFFAWEQARQSSELSHILERITNIQGVTAFIIFDIYENEKYPSEKPQPDDEYEEDEHGYPIKKESALKKFRDGQWEIPPHIIYTSTDLMTAKKIIPFTKQLIWRLVETTRDLDPKNDVRYLRLISDVNEIVVMPSKPIWEADKRMLSEVAHVSSIISWKRAPLDTTILQVFPRHFLIAVQEPSAAPNELFEKLGLVTTHPVAADKEDNTKKKFKNRNAGHYMTSIAI